MDIKQIEKTIEALYKCLFITADLEANESIVISISNLEKLKQTLNK
tara:strand:+ start:398 stop:535 length:138 start_codon:yes stop_codon:yes gene_type:complete